MGCDYYLYTYLIICLKNGRIYDTNKRLVIDDFTSKSDKNLPEVLIKEEKKVKELIEIINNTKIITIKIVVTKTFKKGLIEITRKNVNESKKEINLDTNEEKVIYNQNFDYENDNKNLDNYKKVIKESINTERGYTESDYVNNILDSFKENKVIYENNTWLIKNTSYYTNYLENLNISINDVFKLTKNTYAVERE